MENLHLIPDNGFMNSFIEICNKVSGESENSYVVYDVFSSDYKLKKITNSNVHVAKIFSKEFYEIVGDLTKYKRIFFHFLTNHACEFIIRHKNLSAKFYWPFWGADLYSPFQLFKEKIYDELSLQYFDKHDSFVSTGNSTLDFVKLVKRKFTPLSVYQSQLKKRKEAISRIDFFLHYNEADFILLKEMYSANTKHLPFFYYEYDYSKLSERDNQLIKYLEQKIGITEPTVVQLGHSASLSNNHFSLLNKLAYFKNEHCNFIVPLSYGDKRYAIKVSLVGKEIFEKKFIPVLEYFNKNEYAALLSRIDISIMNHLRTEAAGNVFMMLSMGKKVFLNSNSNLFKYLLKNEIEIFDTNNIEHSAVEFIFQPLSSATQRKNKVGIVSLFNQEIAIKNMENVFSV